MFYPCIHTYIRGPFQSVHFCFIDCLSLIRRCCRQRLKCIEEEDTLQMTKIRDLNRPTLMPVQDIFYDKQSSKYQSGIDENRLHTVFPWGNSA